MGSLPTSVCCGRWHRHRRVDVHFFGGKAPECLAVQARYNAARIAAASVQRGLRPRIARPEDFHLEWVEPGVAHRARNTQDLPVDDVEVVVGDLVGSDVQAPIAVVLLEPKRDIDWNDALELAQDLAPASICSLTNGP